MSMLYEFKCLYPSWVHNFDNEMQITIVEGSTVNTKHGIVKTDHILFVGSGAFHVSKPSDMIPELQGRFPIRVELNSLTEEDFVKIFGKGWLRDIKKVILTRMKIVYCIELWIVLLIVLPLTLRTKQHLTNGKLKLQLIYLGTILKTPGKSFT